MKKLLGILVLGLLLSGNVQAQELTKKEKSMLALELEKIWAANNYC
jgi:hypothetical protein